MKHRKITSSPAMGVWSATSIGVGAMIGAGLFALIGIAVEIAGQEAWLAFVVAGIAAFLTAYSVAKLATRYPSKGGRVTFFNEGYGKGVFAGALNIIMWIGYMIVTALYARAFGEYSLALLGMDGDSIWLHVFCSAVVIFFVFINFLGAAVVGASELLIVAIKVLILLVFGILGLTTMNVEQIAITHEFDFAALVLASGVIFTAYEGFGLVANTAEDIENPRSNLPRALFFSITIVMMIYLLVNFAVIGNLSIESIINAKEFALAEAAKPIMGSLGFTIMGLAALFSTSSAINATLYGPVYMLQETAKAGQISPFFIQSLFKRESGRALLITGLMVLLVSNLLDLGSIAETGSLIFLLIYTAVNIANFKLRRQTASNPFIVMLGIVATGLIFSTLIYYLILEADLSIYLFMAILVTGFLYQWFYQKHRRSF
ncbi:MAG: APC family permease [Pseudomonadota bacterium]|nr:APC family permease [Pseudomonadota bacterium]